MTYVPNILNMCTLQMRSSEKVFGAKNGNGILNTTILMVK